MKRYVPHQYRGNYERVGVGACGVPGRRVRTRDLSHRSVLLGNSCFECFSPFRASGRTARPVYPFIFPSGFILIADRI